MSSAAVFHSLPQYLQRRIDRAFETASGQDGPRKRQKLDDFGGGGFIVPEEVSTQGGFVIESEASGPQEISISKIPTALQLLDLPPDDEEVLAVFRKASSGWADNQVHDASSALVSLDDWRSVCGVLLEPQVQEYADSSDVEESRPQSDSGESDEYKEVEEVGDPEDSPDEYIDEEIQPRRRTRGRKASESPTPSFPKSLTSRQRTTCLEAFALIFPTASASELPSQKIMIHDIQRVAKLLGEKIKAEEIVEMLEMFSTSPDRSMNLSDFERMMIMAKLA
ncbi:hypothetical protein C8J56DRAFT_171990 [Mycena floridula]|nr:hypothetical protein C8J56DRAFT_171990 [Mycena floridula]